MSPITLEEKRLKQLKQQLFGKEKPLASQPPKFKSPQTNNLQSLKEPQISKPHPSETALINPSTIKRDLIKIVSFSFVALAIQLSLFFAIRLGLINLFR